MAFLRTSLLAFLMTGCFSAPQPPCAFTCVGDGVCPAGYSCGGDGICHRDDSQGTCDIPLPIDAAQDTGGVGPGNDGAGSDATDSGGS